MIVDSTHNHTPHNIPEEIIVQRYYVKRVSPYFKLYLERLNRLRIKINTKNRL